jgi:hypothetical protein
MNVQFEPQQAYEGEKHTTMTPFGVSHYITFQGHTCLSVSHLQLLKEFHNVLHIMLQYNTRKIL